MGHGPNKRRYLNKIDRIVSRAASEAEARALLGKIPVGCDRCGEPAKPIPHVSGERIVFYCVAHEP